MTAPKKIWAGPSGEYWSTEDIGNGVDVEYIRADAPELVALVEAASAVVDDYPVAAGTAKMIDPEERGYGSIKRLRAALAAFEALRDE